MMFHIFIMFCWANASPECYAMATNEAMPEIYCVRALPAGAAGAMSTEGFAARVEAFGDDFEIVDVGCYEYDEIVKKTDDPRLK